MESSQVEVLTHRNGKLSQRVRRAMTKKPEAPEVKKSAETKPAEVAAEKKEKVRTSKPGINPFIQANPGKPGRSAKDSRRGR